MPVLHPVSLGKVVRQRSPLLVTGPLYGMRMAKKAAAKATSDVIKTPAAHRDGTWRVKVERAKAVRSAAQQDRQGKPTAFTTRRVPGR